MHKGFSLWNRKFILHELREAIRDADADVVLLQEVLGEHKEHSTRFERWPAGSQYEFLADSLWPAQAYGRNAVYPHGHHGNAVLSKFPIARHQNHDVSVYQHEKRGLLHCQLKQACGSQDLHVICVHLGLFERHRRFQLKRLCRLIDAEVPADAPLVVAGDFNDWCVHANRFLARHAQLREVFVEAFGRSARTFPVHIPMLKLDRIFVRELTTSQPRVLTGLPWRRLSDHAPLQMEICQ